MTSKLLNKPLAVYYSGASGGFMFFLSLQLALGYDVNELITNNWNIITYDNWKRSEVFDMLHHTIKYNGHSLNCNLWQIQPLDTNILLYTDINTQVELARLKKAHWFSTGLNESDLENLDQCVDSYYKIKDPSWPAVETFDDICQLNPLIKNELINVFDFPNLDNKSESQQLLFNRNVSAVYNNIRVDKSVLHIINNVDYKFLLQDVVKTKFKCVTDTLELNHTQEVQDHVDLWVSLHPNKIQKMFYKDI